MAKAAVETALLDYQLRKDKMSLATFLGATQTRVASGVSVGIQSTTDELLETVSGYLAQGYVRIVGRSKDLIISGGLNVYPAEIEDALNNLPGVAESAVVGVPHADFGETGFAFVLAKPGVELQTDQLLAALKAQLANFKVPKQCRVVNELPRNAMGKVQKNLLREMAGKLGSDTN